VSETSAPDALAEVSPAGDEEIVAHDIASLAEMLSTRLTPWNERVDVRTRPNLIDPDAFFLFDLFFVFCSGFQAMAHIRTIASSWDGSLDELFALLQPCIAPLAVQLDDLRSALVKDAALTLVTLAQSLGSHAGPWVDHWLSPLLALARNSKDVFSSSARLALGALVQHAAPWPPTAVNFLLSATTVKCEGSPSSRRTAVTSLAHAIAIWSPAILADLPARISAQLPEMLQEPNQVMSNFILFECYLSFLFSFFEFAI
jgi:hypothetical protein